MSDATIPAEPEPPAVPIPQPAAEPEQPVVDVAAPAAEPVPVEPEPQPETTPETPAQTPPAADPGDRTLIRGTHGWARLVREWEDAEDGTGRIFKRLAGEHTEPADPTH